MNYEEIYNDINSKTKEFTINKGEVNYETLYEAKLAYSILKPSYEEVNIILDGTGFKVTFYNDSFGESYKDFDYMPDKGAGIARFNASIGESWHDTDELTLCPDCGRDLKYLGGMKQYQRYKCDNCGTIWYQDINDNLMHFEDTDFLSDANSHEVVKKDASADYDDVDNFYEAIEKHDDLNPAIWDGDKLKPEVREKLLQIVDMFKQNLLEDEIDLDIKDIYLIGSNAGYNYTKDSDIDCHIMADFSSLSDEVDLVDKLYQARKSLWNDKYDPVINGFDVELYVEPYEEVMEEEVLDEANSSGVYSIMNNTWIKVPNKNDAEVKDVSDQVEELTTKANKCKDIELIDDFIDGVYKMRQEALLDGGEFSEGNLVFKELRNNGILQDLKDKKVKLMNELMSLGD